ncbi:hypothetical protein MXB_1322, partial [Myxobolus squamalis]
MTIDANSLNHLEEYINDDKFTVLVEWVRLYQKSMAFKMSKYGKGAPRACANVEELSYLQSLMLWASNTFTIKADECHEYYSHILVDPLTEISILEAVSSSLRRFFGNYVTDSSRLINNAVVSLLSDLPIQWQLIVFCTSLLTLIVVLLVCMGLEIHSPFFGVKFNKVTQRQSLVSDTEKELRLIQVVKETVKEEMSKSIDTTKEEMRKILTLEFSRYDSDGIGGPPKGGGNRAIGKPGGGNIIGVPGGGIIGGIPGGIPGMYGGGYMCGRIDILPSGLGIPVGGGRRGGGTIGLTKHEGPVGGPCLEKYG